MFIVDYLDADEVFALFEGDRADLIIFKGGWIHFARIQRDGVVLYPLPVDLDSDEVGRHFKAEQFGGEAQPQGSIRNGRVRRDVEFEGETLPIQKGDVIPVARPGAVAVGTDHILFGYCSRIAGAFLPGKVGIFRLKDVVAVFRHPLCIQDEVVRPGAGRAEGFGTIRIEIPPDKNISGTLRRGQPGLLPLGKDHFLFRSARIIVIEDHGISIGQAPLRFQRYVFGDGASGERPRVSPARPAVKEIPLPHGIGGAHRLFAVDDRLRGDGFDALAVQIEGDGVRALFGEVAVDEVIDPLLLVSRIFGVVLQIDLVGGEAVFALIALIALFALRALCAGVALFAADDAAVDLSAVGEGDDQIAVAVDGEAVDADAVLAVLPVFAGDLGDELLERARVA